MKQSFLDGIISWSVLPSLTPAPQSRTTGSSTRMSSPSTTACTRPGGPSSTSTTATSWPSTPHMITQIWCWAPTLVWLPMGTAMPWHRPASPYLQILFQQTPGPGEELRSTTIPALGSLSYEINSPLGRMAPVLVIKVNRPTRSLHLRRRHRPTLSRLQLHQLQTWTVHQPQPRTVHQPQLQMVHQPTWTVEVHRRKPVINNRTPATRPNIMITSISFCNITHSTNHDETTFFHSLHFIML